MEDRATHSSAVSMIKVERAGLPAGTRMHTPYADGAPQRHEEAADSTNRLTCELVKGLTVVEDDDDFSGFECIDCGINTLFGEEYYMLTEDVWQHELGLDTGAGMLCIGCVESRLGRTLNNADFADVPLNYKNDRFMKSDRLSDRISRI
jgi:hypothetical protein